jgi:hypothetical protein
VADERRRIAWGLWNAALNEWFNPGTSKPYFPTRDAAERVLPLAERQYPMGRWQVAEFPLDADELHVEAAGAAPGPGPEPAMRG